MLDRELQSRISLRRNEIREFEELREMNRFTNNYEGVAACKIILRSLTKDQKLDKKLYQLVLSHSALVRHWTYDL